MKLYSYFIIFSFLLLVWSCSNNNEQKKQPVAANGIADLTGRNFSWNGVVELNGSWEFYFNELLEPEDFSNLPAPQASYIKVPGAWDDFVFNGKPAGSFGYATYRLTIIASDNDPLYLKIIPPNSAYKLWANGILLGSIGRVGKSFEEEIPQYKFYIFELKPLNKKIDIVMQVSNHAMYLGGFVIPAKIGTRDKIYEDKNIRVALDIFAFASLLIISIYYSGLYLMRRTDKSNLFFSIFTLLLSIRALITNEMFLYQLMPGVNWQVFFTIDFITTTLSVPVFIHFVYILYPGAVNKKIKFIFNICAAVYSFIIITCHPKIFSMYLPYYTIVTLMACLFVVYIMIRAVIDRQEGARLALAGFLILFPAVINDVLSVNDIINTPQLSSFGVFAFILIQSFISSMKFANAYDRVEDLSHNLEIKVNLRTKELEIEKELLRTRNEIMENELIIAKKIQMQIIPRRSPVENIYAFYKPMDKVGGDFYDFLKYRDSDKIGIFLSDVSGHGVPAAFITSMVKTSILQSGVNREDPANFLSTLNDTLLNQTGGNFVTAYYGIYSPLTRDFVFSNSGHNPPFIFSSGKLKNIEGTRSLPLAILGDEFLRLKKTPRSNSSIRFEKGDKILFYTDGLTEAVSLNDKTRCFEDILINGLFNKYSDRTPKEFIQNIYNELVKFHGSDSFDDDICMICMDV